MKIRNLVVGAIVLFFMAGCSDDDDTIDKSLVDVSVKMPEDLQDKNPFLETATFTFENVNTGEKLVREVAYVPQTFFDVEDGLYNISVEGNVGYEAISADGEQVVKSTKVRAKEDNIEVVGGNFDIELSFFMFTVSEGFVISEIFFASTQTPEGKLYNAGDKYFELYNNSDKLLYADGLCIAGTELQTVDMMNEYTPDIRPDAVPVRSVYMIPGAGQDYPVQPGEALLISDIAIDHRANNSNSFDLSKSNFEWFDGADVDTDVPEVTNMIKMISSLESPWGLHDRGYYSYILFRFDKATTPEQFTEDYAYHYEYKLVFGDFQMWMDFDAWKVPNDLIIDAVGCSTISEYQWLAMSPSLDISYTYSGDSNAARYGHSVKRKVIGMDGERKILQDTNDSAFDFIPTAAPSPGTIEEV
jgi:hypothetical protein